MAGPTGIVVKVLFNNLSAAAAGLKADAANAVSVTTYEGEAEAKRLCPVRTGNLQRSIHSVFSNGGMTGMYGPSAVYGGPVEFGGRNRAARPYVRPSAELVRPRFKLRMEAVAKKGGL